MPTECDTQDIQAVCHMCFTVTILAARKRVTKEEKNERSYKHLMTINCTAEKCSARKTI